VGASLSILTSDDIASSVAPSGVFERPKSRWRSLAKSVAQGFSLIVFTLAFGEAFVRILCPQPVMPRYVTGTPWGVRGNIPYAHYWHYTPEVTIEYRINGQGLRADHEFQTQKTAGTCRVAVFGDSLLMGYEVDLRDSFSTRLEEQLRDRGFAVEVLNFSVSGFGTAEMLRTYEAFARHFDPDFVLFSWHMTDLEDNVRSDLYRMRNGKLASANSSYLPGVRTQDFLMRFSVYRFVSDHSQLYALLRERTGRFTKGLVLQLHQERVTAKMAAAAADTPNEDEDDAIHAARVQVNRELSSAIVELAAKEVAADGRAFYLVEIPIKESRTRFRSSVDVLSDATRSRVNIISPLDTFTRVARPEVKLYYEQGEGHLTPYGVQLLASEAAAALERTSRLSACRTKITDAPLPHSASTPRP
jgi:hypothetical protein